MVADIARTGVGLVVLGLARLVFNISVLRVFGDEALGLANVRLSSAFMLALPLSLSLAPLASQRIGAAVGSGDNARAAALVRKLVGYSLGLTLAWASMVLLAAPVLAPAFAVDTGAFGAVAVLAGSIALHQILKAVLYAVARVQTVLNFEAVAGVFFSIGLLVTLLPGSPIQSASWAFWSFVLLYGSFVLLALFALRPWLRRGAGGRADWGAGAGAFVAWNVAGSAASTGAREIVVLAAAHGWGNEISGVLALLLSLLQPLAFVSRAVHTVLFPWFSRMVGGGDTQGLQDRVARVTGMVALLNLWGVAVFALMPEGLLFLAGMAHPDDAVVAFWCLAVGGLVSFVTVPAINAQVAAGRVRLPALSALVGLALAGGVWGVGAYWASPGLVWLGAGFALSQLVKAIPPFLAEPGGGRGLYQVRGPLIAMLSGAGLAAWARVGLGEVAAAGGMLLVGAAVVFRWLRRGAVTVGAHST